MKTVSDRAGRYAPYSERLVASVMASSGHTEAELRRATLAEAARLGGGDGRGDAPGPFRGGAVPAAVAGYVDKVARHAYQVTDDDVAALRRAGHSDDAIFEITIAAAVGAALGRLERGLRALRSEEPD